MSRRNRGSPSGRDQEKLEPSTIAACESPAHRAPASLNEAGNSPAVEETSDWQLFQKVVRQANAGDDGALDRLRAVLDDNPDVWRRAGDLERMTLRELIDHASSGNRLVSESLERRLAEMRVELGGPRPTPVVALAVERVLACWLHLHALELEGASAKGGDPSPRETWRLKQLDQAHRRYFSALRMLATLHGRSLSPSDAPSATLPMWHIAKLRD